MKSRLFGVGIPIMVLVLVFGMAIVGCNNDSGNDNGNNNGGTSGNGTKPDPGTNFSGTWIYTGANEFVSYKHQISGRTGSWWSYTKSLDWQKQVDYTISWDGNQYITSNYWRININGNILTVENMTYNKQ